MKYLVLAFLLYYSSSFSQVGIGTTNPAPSSILELESSNKALLITRVANTGIITNPVNGMIIYDLSSDCIKFYANNTWTGCITSSPINPSTNGTGIVTSYICTTNSTGTLTIGTPVSGVTQTITANVTSIGTYSISATANGITFSGSGTFTALGSQDIILTATGTPTAAGNFSYSLSTTPSCNFNRTTNSNDAIRQALVNAGCASCASYDAAPVDSWIVITQAEYNQLPITVSNTVRGGIQESVYATATTAAHAGSAHILQVDNGSTSISVPDAHCIYAFKIRFSGSNTHTALKFFDGPANTRDMVQLGPNIPTFTGGGVQYFVYKKSTQLTSGARSIGLHSPSQNLLGLINTTIYYNFTGPTGLNSTYTAFGISLQCLATDTIQW